MKKVIYSLIALAAMVMVAGCAREQAQEMVSAGNTLNATFTVSAPGIATKAISDGTLATKLTFAVYDEAGNYLADLSKTSEEDGPVTITSETAKTFKVTVPLVRDLSYQFLFVAQSAADNGFYTISPADKKVTVDYTKLTANDDNADLFYAYTGEVLVNDAMNTNITLYRPVAQINVAVPDADLTGAAYSIKTDNFLSGITLKQLYPEFNFFTGAVGGTAADVTIAQATRTTDKITVGDAQYNRIAMVYALVDKKNVDATINIKATDKKDVDHDIVRNVPNVPIQANYRTNIIGNIFTSNMTFNVVVDNNFATPDYNVVISSQEELDEVIDAINNGDSTAPTSLTLTADVDGTVLDFSGLTAPLTIPVTVTSPAANEEPKTVVIENLEATTTTGTTPAVTIQAGASAVIEGADLSASTSSDGRAININAGSTVVIRDSKIDGDFDNSGSRGVNVLGGGSSVSVEDSEIKGMYAINLPSSATDNTIVIEDTKVDGWSIFNVWNSGNTIRFNNCELNSKNIYSGTSNAFGAFVINPNVNNTTIIVNDCDITVTAEGDQPQYLVIIKTGATNSVFRATGNTSIDGTASKTQYVISGYSGMTANDYTIDIDDTVSFDWYSGN